MIKLKYADQTVAMEKCNTYQQFLKEIQFKFEFPDLVMNTIKISFEDSDKDIQYLDSDNFDHPEAKSAKEFSIEVIESNLKELQRKNSEQKINQLFSDVKIPTEKKIAEYKKNLIKMCREEIEEKIKKYSEQQENELKDLEKKYLDDVENFRNKVEENSKKNLEKINNETSDIAMKMISSYDDELKKEVDKEISGLVENMQGKIQKVGNIDKINNLQNEMKMLLKEAQNGLKEILESSKNE